MNQSTQKTKTKSPKKERGAFAAFLLDRKIPGIVVSVVLYLCLCYGNWYITRTEIAYMVLANGMNAAMAAFLGNGVTAFFIGGLIPLVVFEFARMFVFRIMRVFGRDAQNYGYTLKLFYAAAYLVYGAFSMIYFAYAPLSFYGETIIKFLFVALFLVLWLMFEARCRMPKPVLSAAVMAVGCIYGTLHLVYAAYMLFSYLAGGLI